MSIYCRTILLSALVMCCVTIGVAKAPVMTNTIEGTVYDERRNPVFNAFVELYNDVNVLTSRARTSTQGRFTFRGMTAGNYTIKVRPYGTNLLEDTQDIQVNNQSSQSDLVIVEFRLRIDKRITNLATGTPGETIYVQDIPQSAKKLYDSGTEKLAKKDNQGLSDLESAIKIFPQYFDALSRLGREYVSRKEFDKGYPYLLTAIDLNQRCDTCYYSLSYAFYQLKQYPAAAKAAMAAAVLDQSSTDIHLLLGTVLRLNGDYALSEKALLKAKSLAKTPNSEIHWQLSLLYNKMKRNQDAANELEAYLKLVPNASNKQQLQELIAKLRTQK